MGASSGEVVSIHSQDRRWLGIRGPEVICCFPRVNLPNRLRPKQNAATKEPSHPLLSYLPLSIAVLSLGQAGPHHAYCTGRAGRVSSCPGKKECKLGRRQAPPFWTAPPLLAILVIQQSAWCSRVLLKPQTSPITSTLVLAQTHTLLGLKMTSVSHWWERSICFREKNMWQNHFLWFVELGKVVWITYVGEFLIKMYFEMLQI